MSAAKTPKWERAHQGKIACFLGGDGNNESAKRYGCKFGKIVAFGVGHTVIPKLKRYIGMNITAWVSGHLYGK